MSTTTAVFVNNEHTAATIEVFNYNSLAATSLDNEPSDTTHDPINFW